MNRLPIRLLALAAVIVLLPLAAKSLSPLADGAGGDNREAAATGDRVRPTEVHAAEGRDPEDLPHGSSPDRARVAYAARCFAGAFSRYELGDTNHRVTLRLSRCGTPRLVATLLEGPPHPAASRSPRSPARVTRITGIRVLRDRAWAVVAVARGRRRSGQSVTLERAPGRFLVDAVH